MTGLGALKNELDKLNEIVLIKKSFLFIAFMTGLSTIGMFVPYVYAIIPVHESAVCMCSFLKSDGNRSPILELHTDNQYYTLQIINIFSYFFVNWAFIVCLIIMGFRIRHIKDNQNMSTELNSCVIIWVICCFFQYVLYLVD